MDIGETVEYKEKLGNEVESVRWVMCLMSLPWGVFCLAILWKIKYLSLFNEFVIEFQFLAHTVCFFC